MSSQEKGLVSKSQVSELSRKVGHDLKSPLRKIRQFSELLSLEYSDILEGDGELYLEALKKSSQQMDALIEGLLDYVRCLTGDHDFEKVDLSSVLNEVIQKLHNKDGIDIKADFEGFSEIRASSDLMTTLFSNLLSNATRFVNSDTTPKIRISAHISPTWKTIHIKDNGIGIEGPGVDKIFDPLVCLHSRDAFEGSGMGLAICKAICDLHGWNIGYIWNETEGTTFQIQIPNSEV